MIEGIIDGIFFNQGHVCCAGSRLLVQESWPTRFCASGSSRRQLRVGDPLDKNTDVGAINSAAQLLRIRELTAFGESEARRATRVRVSCSRATGSPRRSSPTWRSPTDRARRDLRSSALGTDVPQPEEAVAKANNTNYGLACGI